MTHAREQREPYESELTWLSTRELAQRIANREISAREALTDHLARIDSVNPVLNAVVLRDDERAFEQALRADETIASCREIGPLQGVPMTHKESTDVAGLPTTRGSRLLKGSAAGTDALVISRLHKAGVITTGKTNVPEFTAGSHTFNDLFGTTVNPYDQSRSAGGSSGGAAAAIAAGVQAAGDGTDMGGSLRTPASFNNLVGLRPSNGRIPHALPADPWQWLTQAGFMARSVVDVALLMSVAAGPAEGAPQARLEVGSMFAPEHLIDSHKDSPAVLSGLRIGFSADLQGLLPLESGIGAIIDAAAKVFAAAGAEIDDRIPDLADADEVFRVNRALEFAADYGELIEDHRDEIREAVVWNTDMGSALTAAEVISARHARRRLSESVHRFFADHDLLMLTACQVAPFPAQEEYPPTVSGVPMRDYLEWMRAATLISATGCPAISVPAGFTAEGLPVGVQLVAAPGNDGELLRAAHAFESLTGHHRRRPAVG